MSDAPSSRTGYRSVVASCAGIATLLAWQVSNALLTPFSTVGLDRWVNHSARAMIVTAEVSVLVCVIVPTLSQLGLLLSIGFPALIVLGLSVNGLAALMLRGFGGKTEADLFLLFLCVQAVMLVAGSAGVRRAAPGRGVSHRLGIATSVLSVWTGAYWALWNAQDPVHGWWKAYAVLPLAWGAWRWLRSSRSTTTLHIDERADGPQ